MTAAVPPPTIGVMKIALAQLNPTVGDIDGNARRILTAYARAARGGADVVVTPELSLLGYPPRDLLLKPRFIADNLTALQRLAAQVGPTALVVGESHGPVGVANRRLPRLRLGLGPDPLEEGLGEHVLGQLARCPGDDAGNAGHAFGRRPPVL